MAQIKSKGFLISLLVFFIALQIFFSNNRVFNSKSIAVDNCGSWYYNTMGLVPLNSLVKTNEGNTFSFFMVREKIVQLLNKNDPEKFSEENVLKAAFISRDRIYERFDSKIKANLFFDNLTEITGKLLANKQISPQFAAKLEFIHLLTLKDASSKVLLKSINDLKYMKLEPKDVKFCRAFISVYLASYSFWRSKLAEPFNIPSTNCNRALSLAAATGALIGIAKGPEEAVAEALVFSTLATINTPCNAVVRSTP